VNHTLHSFKAAAYPNKWDLVFKGIICFLYLNVLFFTNNSQIVKHIHMMITNIPKNIYISLLLLCCLCEANGELNSFSDFDAVVLCTHNPELAAGNKKSNLSLSHHMCVFRSICI
jgi:hypothetical protein